MKFVIDTDARLLQCEEESIPLFSAEGFALLSKLWLQVGWNERYHYTNTWMGRPILQLPEDIVRLQEVITELKPSVIIETGIAMGGSLLFYATLCEAMDHGRVIGIDVALRPPNRAAIEAHPLSKRILCLEGSSTDPTLFEKVKNEIKEGESVLVILDSNHSKGHVEKELALYSHLVTKGSYLVVTDGFKQELTEVPRGKMHWKEDNPVVAVREFLEKDQRYVLEPPQSKYHRCSYKGEVSHFLEGWLKRVR